MKNYHFLFLLLPALYSCNDQKTTTQTTTTTKVDTVVAAPQVVENTDPQHIPSSGEQPQQFVPTGYFIQYEASGDINQDGIEDVAMILRETADSTSTRAFVVLLGQPASPKYTLADVGWNAIGPQCTAEGYPIRGTEQLDITNGDIALKLYEPGPAGNLFTTYRYLDGGIQLVTLETFSQGAGGASGSTQHLLTGVTDLVEINRMRDPEETTETSEPGRPQKILLRDSNPDELINGKNHL